jgi:hypothetical protein
MREAETPVLGEMNSPKNSKIPQRNQEIANEGSWVTLMVKHEKRRVKKAEGVSSVLVYEPVKTR